MPVDFPITGFAGIRINAFRRAAYSFRTGLSARNGLSLARYDLRLRGFRYEVNVPGLLLRLRILRFCHPFRLLLHCQSRFAPFSAASTLQTRCGVAVRFRRPRLQLQLPLGNVTSLRINASAAFAACQPAFQDCPISVRSPQPLSITRFGCGSSFPARYCPVGLLFLKPLGTNSTMRLEGLFRQRIYASKRTVFLNFYALYYEVITGGQRCKSCA